MTMSLRHLHQATSLSTSSVIEPSAQIHPAQTREKRNVVDVIPSATVLESVRSNIGKVNIRVYVNILPLRRRLLGRRFLRVGSLSTAVVVVVVVFPEDLFQMRG